MQDPQMRVRLVVQRSHVLTERLVALTQLCPKGFIARVDLGSQRFIAGAHLRTEGFLTRMHRVPEPVQARAQFGSERFVAGVDFIPQLLAHRRKSIAHLGAKLHDLRFDSSQPDRHIAQWLHGFFKNLDPAFQIDVHVQPSLLFKEVRLSCRVDDDDTIVFGAREMARVLS